MAGPLNPLDAMKAQFLKWRNSNNPSANNNGVLSTDPSMMEDAELNRMSFQRPPALSQPMVNNTSPNNREAYTPPGASNNTGNARGSSISRPNDQIGFNEMMIRTGGAMMGGARDGGLAALNAATDEYGNIQDANRSNALTRYEEEMRARTALDKANAKTERTQPVDPTAGVAVNDEIGRALEMVMDDQKDSWMPFENINNATGIVGELTKGIPTTNAYRLDGLLTMIKANIGFDKLADMRAKSPTGGALGQVSNLEIGLLQSVWADLRQGNRPEDLEYNLKKLQYHYNNLIHAKFDVNGNPVPGELHHNYKMPTRGSSGGSSQLSSEDAARLEALIQ